MTRASFHNNVFINCPMDEEYSDLLRPLLFTILYLGFTPRLATERLNAGETRISKIAELIEESKYGVHDLSRMAATKTGELFRLNMPFELGLNYACRLYHGRKWSAQKCLILETKKYRYQAALSDLSSSDIKAHGNKPENVVLHVRNWLVQEGSHTGHSASQIWYRFNDFMAWLFRDLSLKHWSKRDIANLPVSEMFSYMRTWMKQKNIQC